jgi:predicted NBD/HSP70 family sugar kinase
VTRVAGIDVGGTKIAAGIVDLATGAVSERLQIPTRPERGADAVLADCVELARRLDPSALGVGVPELVDPAGRTRSAATVDWRDLDLARVFGEVAPTRVESDVRAAALAEARLGAGRGRSSFVYVTISTGISYAFVVDGRPWPGARGNAIVVGAPAVEDLASGAALGAAAGAARAEDVLADPGRAPLVDEAARATGQAIAAIVNALDPELVVIGGGLGSDPRYRARVEQAMRPLIWADETRGLAVVAAKLGPDAGVVGAALAAPA